MHDIGLKEEWNIIKVCLKYKWPDLTRSELAYDEDEEALLEGIVKRTGETRETVEYVLNNYRSSLGCGSDCSDH